MMRGEKRKSRGEGGDVRVTRRKRRASEAANRTGNEDSPVYSDTEGPQVEGLLELKMEVESELDPGWENNHQLFDDSTNQALAAEPVNKDVKVFRYTVGELMLEDEDVNGVDTHVAREPEAPNSVPNVGENSIVTASTSSSSVWNVSTTGLGNDTGTTQWRNNYVAEPNFCSIVNKVGEYPRGFTKIEKVDGGVATAAPIGSHHLREETTVAEKAQEKLSRSQSVQKDVSGTLTAVNDMDAGNHCVLPSTPQEKNGESIRSAVKLETVETPQGQVKSAVPTTATLEEASVIESQTEEISDLKKVIIQLENEKEHLNNSLSRKQTTKHKRLQDKNADLKKAITTKDELIQRQTDKIEGLELDLMVVKAESKRRVATLHEEIRRKTNLIKPDPNELARIKAKYFRDEHGNSPLHLAAQRGDEKAIKDIIMWGPDVNATNKKSETPLILAVVSGLEDEVALKIVKCLIDYKADVFVTDFQGETFLHKLLSRKDSLTPTQFQDISAFLMLKNRSSLFNVRDTWHGRTPFMLAAANVELELKMLSFLHANGVNFTIQDNCGKSVPFYPAEGSKNQKLIAGIIKLEEAIDAGDEELVKLLVKLVADTNQKNDLLETPLHRAAVSAHETFSVKVIKLLIENHADVSAEDITGQTFLHKILSKRGKLALTSSKFLELIKDLAEKSMCHLFNIRESRLRRTPLMLAAQNVQLDMKMISLLQRNGVDFSLKDHNKCTYLAYAAEGNKNGKILTQLTYSGIGGIKLKSEDLTSAISNCDRQSVKVLIRTQGTDVNAKNGNGVPCLHLAALTKNNPFAIEIIKLLIDCGANADVKDEDNCTFLHIFLGDRNLTTVQPSQFHEMAAFLVSRSLAWLFNTPGGRDYYTPFHLAVQKVEIERTTMSLLKRNGMDFTDVHKRGEGPLSFAVRGNRTIQFLSDLVSFGSNPKLLNRNRQSLLHFAATKCRVDLIQFLLEQGLDVNARDNKGKTPLHYVGRHTKEGSSQAFQYLKKNGAKSDVVDNQGKVPGYYHFGS